MQWRTAAAQGGGREGQGRRAAKNGEEREGANARGNAREPTEGPAPGTETTGRREGARRRGEQPPPTDRVKTRSPDVSRQRQPRRTRAGDKRGPDATRQIQGREAPGVSQQPEDGRAPEQAGRQTAWTAKNHDQTGDSAGTEAGTRPQRSQNRQAGNHRGRETQDLNLRSIPGGAPPPPPRVGSPVCRGSVRCIQLCFRVASVPSEEPGSNASGIDSRVERYQTPHGRPWEATRQALREVQTAGNEFEPETSAGQSRGQTD